MNKWLGFVLYVLITFGMLQLMKHGGLDLTHWEPYGVVGLSTILSLLNFYEGLTSPERMYV